MMTKTLFWLQGGGCGGDTMALLGSEWPSLVDMLRLNNIEIIWHPSLSRETPSYYSELIEKIVSGEQALDILVVEGAVIRGPGGSGMYETLGNKPKKDTIAKLAAKAGYVIAAGTCASFGGIGADGIVEATGLQYHKETKGGFLGSDFKSGAGLSVINLPGCPCHCDAVTGSLTALASGADLPMNSYNSPLHWYGPLVHQGCMRNEYHEYRVEETDFGKRGCLFFHMGCRGPLTHGPCNKLVWNGYNSKTSAGVPCFGCTQPGFPQKTPFFQTENIAGIPRDLPEGVDRAHYLAYKGMAAAAAPKRLKDRDTEV
jgi:NiFe hydrogenase small subunit HydA